MKTHILDYELKKSAEEGNLSEYTVIVLKRMFTKVNVGLLYKYRNVLKGVENIMGGKVLDYPEKTIYNNGRNEGIIENAKEKARAMLADKMPIDLVLKYSAPLTFADVEKLAAEMRML